MKKHTILGIDPGLKNTACAIVSGASQYQLIAQQHITTDPSEPLGARLERIYDTLFAFVSYHEPEGIAIERAFHNKNISSSAGTFQVIGLVHLIGAQLDTPVTEITPQAVKRAGGLGGRAKKDEMLRCAKALFGRDFDNHHLADAAFAGIAGILAKRTEI